MRSALACLLLVGCTAAFRSQTGGATVGPGVSGGTMNSLYFSDRGGPLTRIGLAILGAGAAMGSVENIRTTSTTTDNHDGTVTVHTVTTGTINTQSAQAAADLINAAADPKQDFEGMTGELEIASTHLGGDTDGWRFGIGYQYARPISEHWNVELTAFLSVGSFVHHGRMLKTYDKETGQVTMAMGDAGYDIFALPVRLGLPYRVSRRLSVGPVVKVEPNFYPILGDDEVDFYPSPWSAGARVTIAGYVYGELLGSMSAMRSSATSLNLEVGLAF